jgi:hypothetical protein
MGSVHERREPSSFSIVDGEIVAIQSLLGVKFYQVRSLV